MMPKDLLCAAGVCLAVSAAIASAPKAGAARPSGQDSRTGKGPHVEVELIADRAVPGHGMRLGLKFDLEPGWHIYWQNPGDSGGPPEATWTLPPGMMATGFEWPAPERIDIGGLINYGYHNAVLLPVPVAVASGAQLSPDLTVSTSLRWMACANLCVPGKAELVLQFPLRANERAQVEGWKAAIDAARSQVPKPAPASWKASASSAGDTFVIDVLTGAREEQAVFFPLELSQVNDSAAQTVSPLRDGVRLTLMKSSQLVKDPITLRGVITFPGGRSHTIEALLR
jgi:thiol:disulfide interchange protein DsbD